MKRHAETCGDVLKALVLLTYDEIWSGEIMLFEEKQEASFAEVIPQKSLIVQEEPEEVAEVEESMEARWAMMLNMPWSIQNQSKCLDCLSVNKIHPSVLPLHIAWTVTHYCCMCWYRARGPE
ncbi:hypothetical protein NDU88_001492 [Pleurodeles waltl]|uniref:Uncharacterized protein n=1 Tax=Pleurodeles waltl TaxID=8319 RepID=A0AAV7SA83_PLEWA|nr:hypothetical protein NDU88_001492 [Pleurodeles waltl]